MFTYKKKERIVWPMVSCHKMYKQNFGGNKQENMVNVLQNNMAEHPYFKSYLVANH